MKTVQETILRAINREYIIPMSWGFNNHESIENGIKFTVQGFAHAGWVEVILDPIINSLLYNITLKDANLKVVKQINQIQLKDLVLTIDKAVELLDTPEERELDDHGCIKR